MADKSQGSNTLERSEENYMIVPPGSSGEPVEFTMAEWGELGAVITDHAAEYLRNGTSIQQDVLKKFESLLPQTAGR